MRRLSTLSLASLDPLDCARMRTVAERMGHHSWHDTWHCAMINHDGVHMAFQIILCSTTLQA